MRVAIDGPAGSGKSTIARLVASRCGFTYLDTGAMYRAVAWRSLDLNGEVEDESLVEKVAREQPIAFGNRPDGSQSISIAGLDVTSAIRTPEVDAAVPLVARMPGVREEMVRAQRSLAGEQDVVCEGRDIGSCVFPDAEVKIFLTASARTRAERRVAQNRLRGLTDPAATDVEAIYQQILIRDEVDSTREVSPLRAMPDATVIDTSDLSIEEVTDIIVGLIDQARRTPNEEGR